MADITVNLTTQTQQFPPGTTDPGSYTYTITGPVTMTQTSSSTSVKFTSVPVGTYAVKVDKLGVSATNSVTVAAPYVMVTVPLSASASAA